MLKGKHTTLVDSSCSQTTIDQGLVQGEALANAWLGKVRCVLEDIHEYLVMPIIIQFQEHKSIVEVAGSPYLTHPLTWGPIDQGLKY